MKYTNKQNLPQQFVDYANSDPHECKDGEYSVTELLKPVREIVLSRRYADRIEKDVADCVPALLGSAVHAIFERYTRPGAIAEFQCFAKVGEATITGRIDLLDPAAGVIEDYKTCSVSKVMKADFEDWRKQVLMYAWLFTEMLGPPIRTVKIHAIMKDWSKVKAENSPDYPNSAIFEWEYRVSDSDYDYIEGWIRKRLAAIAETETDLPDCTDEEKWYTGTKYAVYKKEGDAKAAKVCDTEEEAFAYIADKIKGVGTVETRPGEYLKCKYYCPCKKFCEKGKQL